MYLGHIVEESETGALFNNPLHPYTQALLAAIPRITKEYRRERIILEGTVPSPINPPSRSLVRLDNADVAAALQASLLHWFRSTRFALTRSAEFRSCRLMCDVCMLSQSICPSRTRTRAVPLTQLPKRSE
jgi:ABC-type glutathione transport system ATPase component